MLKRLHQLGEAKADFAFESTLSSRAFANFLHGLKARGYSVAIYYFSLSSAQLAIRRVKLRVAQGGHHVPPDVVRRRFGRILNDFFNLYAPMADGWALFDNSPTTRALPVATQLANKLSVSEPATWHKQQKLSQTD